MHPRCIPAASADALAPRSAQERREAAEKLAAAVADERAQADERQERAVASVLRSMKVVEEQIELPDPRSPYVPLDARRMSEE